MQCILEDVSAAYYPLLSLIYFLSNNLSLPFDRPFTFTPLPLALHSGTIISYSCRYCQFLGHFPLDVSISPDNSVIFCLVVCIVFFPWAPWYYFISIIS